VIASGIAAYFYVRVIVSMFFTEPTDNTPRVVTPGILSKVAIALCAAVTVVLGIFPQPLLDLADHAAQLLNLAASAS
jgi:NADH-quinone oxidoreductase subunit N